MKSTFLVGASSSLLVSAAWVQAAMTTYASTLTITAQTLEGLDRDDPSLMFVDQWLRIGDRFTLRFTVDGSRPLTGPFDLGLSPPFIFGSYFQAVSGVTLTPDSGNAGLFSAAGPRAYGHSGRLDLYPTSLGTQTSLSISPFGSVEIGGLSFGVLEPSFDPALLGQSLESSVGSWTNYTFQVDGVLGLDNGGNYQYIKLDASPLRVVPAPGAAVLFGLGVLHGLRRQR